MISSIIGTALRSVTRSGCRDKGPRPRSAAIGHVPLRRLGSALARRTTSSRQSKVSPPSLCCSLFMQTPTTAPYRVTPASVRFHVLCQRTPRFRYPRYPGSRQPDKERLGRVVRRASQYPRQDPQAAARLPGSALTAKVARAFFCDVA